MAWRIKREIRGETGLTGSVGVAPNKFLAKLASDLEKPDGLTVIRAEDVERVLSPLPVERIWGVGPKTAERLHGLLPRRHPDAEAAREIVDHAALAPPLQDAEPAEAAEHLERRVHPDAEDGDQRLARAVAAEQDDARPERAERGARVERPAVARRRAGAALDAGQGAQELHLPVALRAGDPEDLALRHLEVDGAEALALEPRHGEANLSAAARDLPVGERELERTPDHERDEALLGHRGRLERALADAVPERASSRVAD
jgi:hypothetical protein